MLLFRALGKHKRPFLAAFLRVAGRRFCYTISVATLVLDTHAFIKKLEASGIPEEQAEAIADGLQQASLDGVATKADVTQLHGAIRDLEIRLVKWLIPLLLGQTAVFALIAKWLVEGP